MVNEFKEFFARLKERWSSVGPAVQLVIAGCLALAGASLALWLVDKVFLYLLARSYVDDVANVLDLNEHLAKAISIAVLYQPHISPEKHFHCLVRAAELATLAFLRFSLDIRYFFGKAQKIRYSPPRGNQSNVMCSPTKVTSSSGSNLALIQLRAAPAAQLHQISCISWKNIKREDGLSGLHRESQRSLIHAAASQAFGTPKTRMVLLKFST
jgi:hypothetical protein